MYLNCVTVQRRSTLSSLQKRRLNTVYFLSLLSTFIPSKGTARKLIPKKQNPSLILVVVSVLEILISYYLNTTTNFNIDRDKKLIG